MKKLSGLYHYLIYQRIFMPHQVIEPNIANFSSIHAAHTSRYSHGLWEGSLSIKGIRRIGLPWSKDLALLFRLAKNFSTPLFH